MAEPTSCANTSFWIGSVDSGLVVDKNTGEPSGMNVGSTAIERSSVSGTPSLPMGPPVLPGVSAKKT